jgi:hypothetical protein
LGKCVEHYIGGIQELDEENPMRIEVGLWIDRRKAVIVTIAHEGDGIRSIQSTIEKHVRFSGILSQDGWVGNMQDRKFANYLLSYYDDVIACILDADSIQIFGPGEAKLQLEKRLRYAEMGGSIVRIETIDKMTDRQLEGKIWQHYLSLIARTDAQIRTM